MTPTSSTNLLRKINPISCKMIQETLSNLITHYAGDLNTHVTSVTPPDANEAGSLVFVSQPKAFEKAFSSDASAIVVPQKYFSEMEVRRGNKLLLCSPNVELAMALTIRQFFFKTPYVSEINKGIHPTSVIDPTAEIGAHVTVGPHAIIGPRVKIADRSHIGANSVIEADTTIGEETTIHPLVYIGHSCTIGNRCEVLPHSTVGKEGFGYAHDAKGNHYRIPHQGQVVLEDDVHIGASCTIDRGTFGETRIGSGTKMDNQSHIGHNSKIGRNGLITAHFAIAGSSEVGDNFVAGGKSVVTGHIRITDNVHLAGKTGVSKSIEKPGQYGGYPMQPLKDFLRTKAAIMHLADMRKQINVLMKKVFPEGNDSGSTDET